MSYMRDGNVVKENRQVRRTFSLNVLSFLVILLLLLGCGPQESITAGEIMGRVRETWEGAVDIHATWELSLDMGVIQDQLVVEMWRKQPDKLRAEVLEAASVEFRGMTLVSDGAQAWLYNPSRRQVTAGEPEAVKLPLVQDVIESIDRLIHAADAGPVKLLGTEKISAGETYKLEMPHPDGGQALLWISAEYWVPLRVEYASQTLGKGTLVARSLELNTDLSDSLFLFEAPADVQVTQAGGAKSQALTLDEARARVGFPLLVPAYLPQGVILVNVFQLDDAVAFNYNGPAPFTIVQGRSEAIAQVPQTGPVQKIALRGTEATLIIAGEDQGGIFLAWAENGVSVSIAGTISVEEALRVAESLS
jgi:outer membrane lipoprotein-sorting protein